ncbi:catalase [Algoriella xinjiangensis]|uniref:Catalase n=1 Tax=Algoriella xinjiangensis TaxID=684065 RepID=A0A1I4S338_9FLAO|nr:catalase [Algoriella xinjiangensis]SFM58690.1 catalase [Algoriella xinjiangensis]VDH15867.1 Catalase precursor [Algoriella xinjiangensis]
MIKRSLILSLAFLSTIGFAQQMTTNTGAPIGDNSHSKTVGKNGPVLLEDFTLLEKLAAFDREKIPERVVHARGAGAFGEFVASADFSDVTKADFLSQAGKKTPLVVRFSTVTHQAGSPETYRDPRGFAVKFYTQEGNYDLVGNNLPVFFIRDAINFPDMVHAFHPSPVTNGASDPNRVFDFFSEMPEGAHMLTWLFSDYGTPANYRQMEGNGVHAYKWINDAGEVTYVKYKWVPQQEVKNLNTDEAAKIQSMAIEHATLDLRNEIDKGNFPKWDLYVQMMKKADFDKFDFNPVDVTKIWPADQVKSVKVGTMTLNKNPENYFQQVESAAYSPATLVPGIEPSEDKLLQGRLFSYGDTQRHRLTGNFQQIAVNAPIVKVTNNNKDGYMSMREQKGNVNYQPATSRPDYVENAKFEYSATEFVAGTKTVQDVIDKENNFQQAGELYLAFSKKDQDNLIKNLSGALNAVNNKVIVYKMIAQFYQANSEYGTRLMKATNTSINDVKQYLPK